MVVKNEKRTSDFAAPTGLLLKHVGRFHILALNLHYLRATLWSTGVRQRPRKYCDTNHSNIPVKFGKPTVLR